MTETIYCARHPDTATGLRCTRCDKPVCPQCMVNAPVGIRCPDCGKGVSLPVYDVSRSLIARAVLASLALGVGGGFVIAFVILPLPLGIFLYAGAMAGFGYVMGGAVSWAAGGKKGRALQWIAIGGVVVATLIVFAVTVLLGGTIEVGLLGGGLAAYVAFIRLR